MIVAPPFLLPTMSPAGSFSGPDFLRIVKNNAGINATAVKPIAHQKEVLNAPEFA